MSGSNCVVHFRDWVFSCRCCCFRDDQVVEININNEPPGPDPGTFKSAQPEAPVAGQDAIDGSQECGTGRQTTTKTLEKREMDWKADEQQMAKKMKQVLRKSNVEYLNILVHGPVGAGKSNFINSINRIFQKRAKVAIKAEETTEMFTTYKIKDNKTPKYLMVLETQCSEEVHPNDLIKVLKGQIKFNPTSSETGPNPTVSERIHCLVSVVPADRATEEDDFNKMKQIITQAKGMKIPQIIILTKVDLACTEVKKNITNIFLSRTINEKMEECSSKLGVPKDCIFPVKNYQEEADLDPNLNMLLLSALKPILTKANRYVEESKS